MDCQALWVHRDELCDEYGHEGLCNWGDTMVARGRPKLPPGPVVVPKGVTVEINPSDFCRYTDKCGLGYAWRDRPVAHFTITGPATALDVMNRLSQAAHHEAARTYLLGAVFDHALFAAGIMDKDDWEGGLISRQARRWAESHPMPREQLEKFKWDRKAAGKGAMPPVLEIDPDPTAGLTTQDMVRALGGQGVLEDSDPGSTYLSHFRPDKPPTNADGHPVYIAEWVSVG